MDLPPEAIGGTYRYRICPIASDPPIIAGRLQEVTGEPIDSFPQAVLEQMPPPFRMSLSEIKLIGPKDEVTKALVAARERLAGRSVMWHTGGNLGMMPVELAYVYPPVEGTPSSDAPEVA